MTPGHFRKQAKLYLRWHREGYFPVAAQIRLHLPRFAALSEPEILQARFKLADAQELVARKSGFGDWPALVEGITTLNAPLAAGDKAVILASEPQLFVRDMAASLAFYTEKLGFQVALSYGEPPFWAQVARDGGRLNLRQVSVAAFSDDFRVKENDPISATLTLDTAKPLFLEFFEAGVEFHQSLRTEPWGARTFIVADPDGNLILFAGS
jgi:catechol 2,3-dioxygenase-like lactoylglutathione lyase family enzyme